jgi:hypothetical protein
MSQFDLAVVGFGIRGLGLVTANPALRERRVLVIHDLETAFGAGAFAQIHCQSNSAGRDFFSWVDTAGPYGPVLSLPAVRRLHSLRGCFELPILARALREAAHFVRRTAPAGWHFECSRVEAVSIESPGSVASDGASLRLTGGRTVRAGVVVLATGVEEQLEPTLAADARVITTSSTVFAEPRTSAWGRRLPERFGPVTIIGAAHSAFSSLLRLLEFGVRPEDVTLVGRGPVRLHYESLAAYAAASHSPHEREPAPDDVCPLTGQVFRYHGLRHRSRDLFLEIVSGRLPVSLRTGARPDEIRRYVMRADLTVQATGLCSTVPQITRRGRSLALSAVVTVAPDGHLLDLGGAAVPGVFVMGCNPYPYAGNIDPTTQYADRGRSVARALTALDVVRDDRHGGIRIV